MEKGEREDNLDETATFLTSSDVSTTITFADTASIDKSSIIGVMAMTITIISAMAGIGAGPAEWCEEVYDLVLMLLYPA